MKYLLLVSIAAVIVSCADVQINVGIDGVHEVSLGGLRGELEEVGQSSSSCGNLNVLSYEFDDVPAGQYVLAIKAPKGVLSKGVVASVLVNDEVVRVTSASDGWYGAKSLESLRAGWDVDTSVDMAGFSLLDTICDVNDKNEGKLTPLVAKDIWFDSCDSKDLVQEFYLRTVVTFEEKEVKVPKIHPLPPDHENCQGPIEDHEPQQENCRKTLSKKIRSVMKKAIFVLLNLGVASAFFSLAIVFILRVFNLHNCDSKETKKCCEKSSCNGYSAVPTEPKFEGPEILIAKI